MDESRPSFEDGVLRIPGQGGAYASLTLSNHRGNEESSSFDFEVAIPEVVSVRGSAAHLEKYIPLAPMWNEIPREGSEKGSWSEWYSEDGHFLVSVTHDGLGHYVLRLKLQPHGGYDEHLCVHVPVMVEAGWLPRVAEWWQHFFEHPQP